MSFISCNYVHTDRLIHNQYARILEYLCTALDTSCVGLTF